MITWLSNFIHLLQISNSLKFGFIELSLCQQRKPSSSSSHLYFLSSAFVLLYLTSHSLFWVAYPQITDFFFSFFLSLECFQQSTNQSGDLNEDAGSTDFKLIFFLLYNYIFFYSVVFFCFCCYWYIYIYIIVHAFSDHLQFLTCWYSTIYHQKSYISLLNFVFCVFLLDDILRENWNHFDKKSKFVSPL